jgi:hypothetical protein
MNPIDNVPTGQVIPKKGGPADSNGDTELVLLVVSVVGPLAR